MITKAGINAVCAHFVAIVVVGSLLPAWFVVWYFAGSFVELLRSDQAYRRMWTAETFGEAIRTITESDLRVVLWPLALAGRI